MKEIVVTVEGKEVTITNPDRLLWPELGVTKKEYIAYLTAVSPYLLPYTRDRMLMIWRYPEGVGKRRFEERSIHGVAPDWIPRVEYKQKERILLNDTATLIWVANLNAIELHVHFDKFDRMNHPTELVLDLDPPDENSFELVTEVSLAVKSVLDSLSLTSIPKTSGATGLQIYVPIKPEYPYEDVRRINKFLADYLVEQLPNRITLDRVVKRRGQKLYLDYLQLWKGRTMAAPYSCRARKEATVSAPLLWKELENGVNPMNYTIMTVPGRVEKMGDLFRAITTEKQENECSLEAIIEFLKTREGKGTTTLS
jgi:bifunctional non-homologous end joining protein LigD